MSTAHVNDMGQQLVSAAVVNHCGQRQGSTARVNDWSRRQGSTEHLVATTPEKRTNVTRQESTTLAISLGIPLDSLSILMDARFHN